VVSTCLLLSAKLLTRVRTRKKIHLKILKKTKLVSVNYELLMRSMEESDLVKLKIKSPSSVIKDMELEVLVTTSVYQLKEIVRERFPGNPTPSAQKLLYAGKLLKDVDIVQNFLRFDDDCSVYTLHLACTIPPSINNNRGEQVDSLSGSGGAAGFAAGPADTLGWQWQQAMMGMYGQNMMGEYNMVNLGPTEIQQLALVQQMYTQYLAEYMRYAGGGGVVSDTLGPPQVEVGTGQQQQQGDREQLNNAGAPPPLEDEADVEIGGRNGDLLDWLYMMSRLVVLASIVYFYSSFTRFLMVAMVVGFLYLYQAGYFGQRDRVDMIRGEVDRIRVREVQEVNTPAAGEVPEEANDDSGDDATLEHDPQNLQIGPNETDELPAPLNPLVLARNFVTMFFTSLIPDNNQVI